MSVVAKNFGEKCSIPDYKRRYKIMKTTELKAFAFTMALFASLPFIAACAQNSVSRAEAQNDDIPFRRPQIVNDASYPVYFGYKWCTADQKVCTKVMNSTLNPYQAMTYTNQQFPQYGRMVLMLPNGAKVFSALDGAGGFTPVRCSFHIYERNGRLLLMEMN